MSKLKIAHIQTIVNLITKLLAVVKIYSTIKLARDFI